jgi:hypothetical protein
MERKALIQGSSINLELFKTFGSIQILFDMRHCAATWVIIYFSEKPSASISGRSE